MIELHDVGVTYADAARPVLTGVALTIPEGELALVVGRTGSGKSTLLRTINGLVPHFSGGTLHGRVLVDGRDTRTHRPRDLADIVGYVGQDPLAGFVTDTVEDELAYGMESLGLSTHVMRSRVEETLDLLGLAEVRSRPVADLSGGQQQRVAIGSVLTTHPRVLVLDEPTSALDPVAAEDVLATLQRLVHDLGLTVVLAAHRLERVVQYADRVVLLPGEGRPVRHGLPGDVLADSPVAPPVVELGRVAGWSPLPLSVRDARRVAGPLRGRLAGAPAPERRATAGRLVASCSGLVVSYGRTPALRGVTARLSAGEVVALMDRNGAGRSTLLKALVGMNCPPAGHLGHQLHVAGSLPPARGRVEVAWLTAYAVVVGLAYGLVMNLWFWPFASYGPETSWVTGDSFASNLSRYLLFYVTTSLPWDLGRSVLAGLVLLLAGSALLRALRRASRRAAFDAVATFEPGGS